ncbi:protein translocase subunit SecF [Corynebacterium uterequi]|uniref:Protein translocase subunit SecF n=1 Tax=Corynebacterium uterequi TaxID=1072256 RepID=A0A0G3HD61_9CORY|nr:protein translocase subunit SecF [Corynebacterium uterequi]AKK11234.1 protein-export membrane protein SecF [Corynebacterium uterequi]
MSSTAHAPSRVSFFDRLYTGDGGFRIIQHSKLWYGITIALLVISVVAMLVRGFDLSIDFEGGTKVSMPAGDLVAEQVETTFEEATGVEAQLTQIVGAGDSRVLEINSDQLTEDQAEAARLAIVEAYGASGLGVSEIGVSNVSESWGSTITNRMVLSMLVFLVLAGVYVAMRLEKEMAAAALLALVVDGVVIAGLYALFGLEVSPAVVIGLLTVLTFSIYDTVVVFDKVRENTAGVLESRRATYTEQANLAVNQTIMRSLSTSVISALPIVALFVVAVWLLGIGTLRDLAVIQLIGVVEGLLSSLFLATPLLVTIVTRQRRYRRHTAEVLRYRAAEAGANGAEGASGLADAGHDEEEETRPDRAKRTVITPRGVHPGSGETATTWRPNRS